MRAMRETVSRRSFLRNATAAMAGAGAALPSPLRAAAEQTGRLVLFGWLFNVNQPTIDNAQVFGKLYFGDLMEESTDEPGPTDA